MPDRYTPREAGNEIGSFLHRYYREMIDNDKDDEMDESVLDTIGNYMNKFKSFVELKRNWNKFHKQIDSKVTVEKTLTPRQVNKFNFHKSMLSSPTIDYEKYKESFDAICEFFQLDPLETVIEEMDIITNPVTKEYTFRLRYSAGLVRIELPEDTMLCHSAMARNIKELRPSFKSKTLGQYCYPMQMCYFTLKKKVPKEKAGLQNKKTYEYTPLEPIKYAYIDPCMTEYEIGSVFVPTDKPMPVVRTNPPESVVVNEAAAKVTGELYPVYIILFSNDTNFGKLIRKATGSEYSHATVALDPTMNNMYSFSDIPYNEAKFFTAGFVRESIWSPEYTKNRHFRVLVTFVDKEGRDKMQKKIDYFINNFGKYKYNDIGLIQYYFKRKNTKNHDETKKMRWFCSEFVSGVVNSSNEVEGFENVLASPEDLSKNPNVIDLGKFTIPEFDEAVLIRKTKNAEKVFRSNAYLDEIITESTDEDFGELIDQEELNEAFGKKSKEKKKFNEKEVQKYTFNIDWKKLYLKFIELFPKNNPNTRFDLFGLFVRNVLIPTKAAATNVTEQLIALMENLAGYVKGGFIKIIDMVSAVVSFITPDGFDGAVKYPEKALVESAMASQLADDYEPAGKKKLNGYRKVAVTPEYIKANKAKYPFLKHVRTTSDTTGVLWLDGTDPVACVVTRKESDNVTWITSLDVFPDYRNYGLGNQVLDYAVRKMGANSLTVAYDNKVAKKMYDDYGFREMKGEGKSDKVIFMTIRRLSESAVTTSETKTNKPAYYYLYQAIDTIFGHNELIKVWGPSVDNYSDLLWKGEAWRAPEEIKMLPIKSISGIIPENITEGDYINLNVCDNADDSSWIEFVQHENAILDEFMHTSQISSREERDAAMAKYGLRQGGYGQRTNKEDEERALKSAKWEANIPKKQQKKIYREDGTMIIPPHEFPSKPEDLSELDQINELDEAAEDPTAKLLELNKKLNKFDYLGNMKNYTVRDAKTFEKENGGVCWDFVVYQNDAFRKLGIKSFTTYYVVFDKSPNYPTHTFQIIRVYSGKYIYFESSYQRLQGVYEAETEEDLISLVINTMIKQYDLKGARYEIRKYNAGESKIIGMNTNEFMNYMNEKPKVQVSLKKDPEYRKITASDLNEGTTSLEDRKRLAKERNVPIFICLFHFSSVLSTLIALVTQDEYSHAAISFDTSLTDMYSFGKMYPNNPIIGNFVHESLFGDTYNQVTKHAIYTVFVTPEEKKIIQDQVKWFVSNQKKLRYNYEGLLKSLFKIPEKDGVTKYAYLCSEFVSMLLKSTGRDFITTASNLVKPNDFQFYPWCYYLGSGKGRAYDQASVDKKLKEIMRRRKAGEEAFLENATDAGSVVYFTKSITPESLSKMVSVLTVNAQRPLYGKTMVKISSGEPGGHNYLKPELISKLCDHVNGVICDTTTAYAGERNTKEGQLKTMKAHGFTDIAPVDVLDGDGERSVPVKDGYILNSVRLGYNTFNYDNFVILSHFKGHAMAGYGGALKNVCIGLASRSGKSQIRTYGNSSTLEVGFFDKYEQELFLKAMSDASKTFIDIMNEKGPVLYINVANNLSIDCDCNNHPADPTMADIGIFASWDPVAVDQACIDAVYHAPDGQDLIKRIEEKHGEDLLDYAEKQGVGSRTYQLFDLDTNMNESLETFLTKPGFNDMILYHGSPEKHSIIRPTSYNDGTRLSKLRMSSFWIEDADLAVIFAIWNLTMKFVEKHDKIDLYTMTDVSRKVYAIYNNPAGKKLRDYLKSSVIYIHQASIPRKYLGRGHARFIGEYTVDVDVPVAAIATIKGNSILECCEFLDTNEFQKRYVDPKTNKLQEPVGTGSPMEAFVYHRTWGPRHEKSYNDIIASNKRNIFGETAVSSVDDDTKGDSNNFKENKAIHWYDGWTPDGGQFELEDVADHGEEYAYRVEVDINQGDKWLNTMDNLNRTDKPLLAEGTERVLVDPNNEEMVKKYMNLGYNFIPGVKVRGKAQPMFKVDITPNDQLYPVYVVLFYSDTLSSKIIRAAAGPHFSHAALSLDPKLKTMYSFGKKNGLHIEGFVQDSIHDEEYQKNNTAYAVYLVCVTADQYDNMKKRLEWFTNNKTKFKYNFSGLFKNYLGISDNPETRYFCSQFVADILNAGSSEKKYFADPSMVTPETYVNATFTQYVTSGPVSEFNGKEVERIAKLLRMRETKHRNTMTEAATLKFETPLTIKFDKYGIAELTVKLAKDLDRVFNACATANPVLPEHLFKLHYAIELIDRYLSKGQDKKSEIYQSIFAVREKMLSVLPEMIISYNKEHPDFHYQTELNKTPYAALPNTTSIMGTEYRTLL